MRKTSTHRPAHNPQELEQLLVARQRAGDIAGMIALYEPNAVIDDGQGRLLRGLDAIREFFEDLTASGRKFNLGTQRSPLISDDLALTSSLSASGNTTAEIARRQADGSWRWVVDQFSITRFSAPTEQNQC